MMDHLYKDFEVDKDYSLELFLNWTESELDIPYTEWLQLLTYHYCQGGGSNEAVNDIKKTVAVLVQELNKSKL